MDENSCLLTKNVIPTVVKNEKTTGLVSQAGGRSTEGYLKCQVHIIEEIYLNLSSSASK